MLGNEQSVEECDATEVDNSKNADRIYTILQIKNYLFLIAMLLYLLCLYALLLPGHSAGLRIRNLIQVH